MGVIVGRSRAEIMQPYFDRYFQQQQERDRAAQQQAQFDQQLALEKQRTDSTVGYQGAQTDATKQKSALDLANAKAAGFVERYKAVLSSDGPDAANQFASQFLQANPDTKDVVAGYVNAGPTTSADRANMNTSKFAADTTGRAAAGSNDPMAVNFTTKQATGAFLPEKQFAYQGAQNMDQPTGTPAQPGPNATKAIRRETGDLATAGQQLAANTQVQLKQMDNAQSDKEMGAVVAGASERDVKQSVSGNKYADISGYTGKTKNALLQRYREAGIPVVDNRADADALREIDNAKLNQQSIFNDISPLLPKDAQGRIAGEALGNTFGQFLQTNNTLGSYTSWRAAAIQSLRAMAGSKGLRINQAEIKMAVENDIPKLTDTVGVAMGKLQNINTMLDNAERATLNLHGKTSTTDKGSAVESFLQKHGIQ